MDGLLSFSESNQQGTFDSKLRVALKNLETRLQKYKNIEAPLFFYIGKVYSYRTAEIMEEDIPLFVEEISKQENQSLPLKANALALVINKRKAILDELEELAKNNKIPSPTKLASKKSQPGDEEEKTGGLPSNTKSSIDQSGNASTSTQQQNIDPSKTCHHCKIERPDSFQSLENCKHTYHTKCIATILEVKIHKGEDTVCPECNTGIEYKEMMGIFSQAGFDESSEEKKPQQKSESTQLVDPSTTEEELKPCPGCGKIHPPHDHSQQQQGGGPAVMMQGLDMNTLMMLLGGMGGMGGMGPVVRIVRPGGEGESQQESPTKKFANWECPQCDTVGQIERGNPKFECKKCGLVQCLRCRNEWHEGMTCEQLLEMLGES